MLILFRYNGKWQVQHMQQDVMPVETIRDTFETAFADGSIVITAPTGSGKSSQIPRWLSAYGSVLVIEPRRVACRALAAWVSELESSPLGTRVGYAIRDEDRQQADTKILFVTPGVALRMLAHDRRLSRFCAIVIDEFHERSWQIDALLALVNTTRSTDLVVMSATMDAAPLAGFLGATMLEAGGRRYPVEITYAGLGRDGPTIEALDTRVLDALDAITNDGDVLVFLPGKLEIEKLRQRIAKVFQKRFAVHTLHSGLNMAEQQRVFANSQKPKLILSTNIAQTSLTLPNVTLVIDSGLVRQTQYFQGRGFLGLVPIAKDAADQRSGRAGRVRAGRCVRLWSKHARMELETEPEVLREGLSPLLLAILQCGYTYKALDFFTAPKTYAVQEAHRDLVALGACGETESLTEIGRVLARLPLDPHLGRLTIQAERDGCLPHMLLLVAMLSQQRPVRLVSQIHPIELTAAEGCDVWRFMQAFFGEDPNLSIHENDRRMVTKTARRLANAFGTSLPKAMTLADRQALLITAVKADRRFVFLSRTRRHRVYWTNGEIEASVSTRTALHACMDRGGRVPASVIAFELFGLSLSKRRRQVQMSWVMPISLSLVESEVKTDSQLVETRIGSSGLEGRYAALHANRQLHSDWRPVADAQVLEGLLLGLGNGWIWPKAWSALKRSLGIYQRHVFLNDGSLPKEYTDETSYVRHWFAEVGIEGPSDLLLVDSSDLRITRLDETQEREVLRRLPERVLIGSKPAEIRYDLSKKRALLVMDKKWVKGPFDARFLPRVEGFTIAVLDGTRQRIVRK